jgi:hypothetical protein
MCGKSLKVKVFWRFGIRGVQLRRSLREPRVLWELLYLGAIQAAFQAYLPLIILIVLPFDLGILSSYQLVDNSIDYLRFSYYTLNESSKVMDC